MSKSGHPDLVYAHEMTDGRWCQHFEDDCQEIVDERPDAPAAKLIPAPPALPDAGAAQPLPPPPAPAGS